VVTALEGCPVGKQTVYVRGCVGTGGQILIAVEVGTFSTVNVDLHVSFIQATFNKCWIAVCKSGSVGSIFFMGDQMSITYVDFCGTDENNDASQNLSKHFQHISL
jgi:hypothetical protein